MDACNLDNAARYGRMKTVLFISTPTSATRAMNRIYRNLCPRGTEFVSIAQKGRLAGTKAGALQTFKDELQPEGRLLFLNQGDLIIDSGIDLGQYFLVLNMRDPRDLVCNWFYWSYQHPLPKSHKEKEHEQEFLRARKEELFSAGMDRFALDYGPVDHIFRGFYHIVENCDPASYLINSYALLCTQFDVFIDNFCKFTDVSPPARILELLRNEQADSVVSANASFIGRRWEGADKTVPGRYKEELSPETIRVLNERYAKELDFLATHDHPLVRHLYKPDA